MYYVYVLQSDVGILGDLAGDYCPELKGIIPRETDGQKVGVRPPPIPLFTCSPVHLSGAARPASPDFVVIKMTPENIRFMESTDMKYSQVKLK